MRQTLFYIPHALGPLPLFGWVSWSMLALILYFGITLWDTFKRSGEATGKAAFMDGLFNWAIGAGVLGYVLPMIEIGRAHV